MDASRFDRLARHLRHLTTDLPAGLSRRHLMRGLAGGAALGAAAGITARAGARPKALCTKAGGACRREGKRCQASNCLSARFTVEAVWTNPVTDNDTYVFVPRRSGSSDPHPFVDYECNPSTSGCKQAYPFVCVDQDAGGPGDEVTTVHKLLDGKYEYWIELFDFAPAGDVTVNLRRRTGRLVRSWQSPSNEGNLERGWHVFDVDGRTGRVTSVNAMASDYLPDAAHNPSTNVCPPA